MAIISPAKMIDSLVKPSFSTEVVIALVNFSVTKYLNCGAIRSINVRFLIILFSTPNIKQAKSFAAFNFHGLVSSTVKTDCGEECFPSERT